MTSKITRERLQEIAEDGFLKHGESKELARMALSAMDSEPVAWLLSGGGAENVGYQPDSLGFRVTGRVTHWMPLPAAPKQENI